MQKTAYEVLISDWSADVCSSDLLQLPRQWPRSARQLDRALRSGRAGAAADHQCVGDVDLQCPHTGSSNDRRAGRRPEHRAGRDRRVDRKDVGEGKSVSVRLDLGGQRSIKKKNKTEHTDGTKSREKH